MGYHNGLSGLICRVQSPPSTLFSNRNVPLIHPFSLMTLGQGQWPWVMRNFLNVPRSSLQKTLSKNSFSFLHSHKTSEYKSSQNWMPPASLKVAFLFWEECMLEKLEFYNISTNSPGNNMQKTPFKNSSWLSHNLKIFE